MELDQGDMKGFQEMYRQSHRYVDGKQLIRRMLCASLTLVMGLAAGCREAEDQRAEVPRNASQNIETYTRGERTEPERPEIDRCYNGVISVNGANGGVDTRPLILCVEKGEVSVWINSEIYPTGATAAAEGTIKAEVLLAGDETMALVGDYADGSISGKVVRSNGASGSFEVSDLSAEFHGCR